MTEKKMIGRPIKEDKRIRLDYMIKKSEINYYGGKKESKKRIRELIEKDING